MNVNSIRFIPWNELCVTVSYPLARGSRISNTQIVSWHEHSFEILYLSYGWEWKLHDLHRERVVWTEFKYHTCSWLAVKSRTQIFCSFSFSYCPFAKHEGRGETMVWGVIGNRILLSSELSIVFPPPINLVIHNKIKYVILIKMQTLLPKRRHVECKLKGSNQESVLLIKQLLQWVIGPKNL